MFMLHIIDTELHRSYICHNCSSCECPSRWLLGAGTFQDKKFQSTAVRSTMFYVIYKTLLIDLSTAGSERRVGGIKPPSTR